MTKTSILKGILGWALERASEMTIGSGLVGLAFYLSGAEDEIVRALRFAVVLVFSFYVFCGYAITTIFHNYSARAKLVLPRAKSLALAFSIHFVIFSTLILLTARSAVFMLLFLAICYTGGLVTTLAVNTIATVWIRKLLKIA